jgi:amino acid adenylation domain-containing protein
MTSPAFAAPAEVEGRLVLSLGAAFSSRLEAMAGEAGVSLRDVLAGAWALVLHAYTGQDEVTLQLLPGGRRAKVRPTGGKPVARLLKEVRRSLGAAEAALPSFAYQEDLVLRCHRVGESLEAAFEFDPARFDEAAARSMKNGFRRILEQVAAHHRRTTGTVDLLSEDDARRMARAFNDTRVEYDRQATLHGLFERQAAATPDAVALLFRDRSLTYRELNARANQLAARLRARRVGADQVVGVLAERSLEMMVGLLAILKAGGAYLPLSPDFPPARRGRILADSGARVLLTTRALSAELPALDAVLLLDDPSHFAGPDANPRPLSGPRDLAYVIYTSGSTGEPKGVMIEHTSAVNRLNWMQTRYPIGPDDTLLQKTPYTFDVSVWELFWWALAGARLSLLAPGDERHPDRITEAVERHRVTVAHFVPSMLGAFLEHVKSSRVGTVARLRSLRQVFASGEALQGAHVRDFHRLLHGNGTRLSNLYGPTEATVDVSYYDCGPEEGASVPIGRPIDNTALVVVDPRSGPQGRLQPVGFAGELCIAGVNLARGYLNNPALTAEKFVDVREASWSRVTGIDRVYRTGDLARWRPDGNLEYLGRMDSQVKIRGFRVELGEIEAHLLEHPAVRAAAAVVRTPEAPVLGAYYVPRREVGEAELRAFLAERVPEYMVPSFFVRLDALPLTSSGKTDRKALPAPAPAAPRSRVAPRSDLERMLAQDWRDILGVGEVGVHDDFFALGGHSIKAIQLIARLQTRGLQATTNDVFSHPTIEALARYLALAGAAAAGTAETRGEGERPALRMEDLPALEQEIEQARLAYQQAVLATPVVATFAPSTIQRGQLRLKFQLSGAVLPFHEPVDSAALDRAFTRLVHRHGFLRSALVREGRRLEWREHAPAGALRVPVVDLSDRAVDRPVLMELINRVSVVDLGRQELAYKALLIRLHERESYLVLPCHHTIHDQTCTEVLKRELARLYEEPGAELPEPEPYTGYIRLLEQGPIGVDEEGIIEAFDLREYRGARRRVEALFAGRVRPRTTYYVHRVPFRDERQKERSFQLSYLIVNAFLGRYLQTERVPLKILYNGRSYADHIFLDTIGEFIDFVPVLVDLSRGPAAVLEDASARIRFASRHNLNFMSLFMDDALRRRWSRVYECLRPDLINWNDMTVVFNFLGIGEPLEIDRFVDLYQRARHSPQEIVPDISSFYCEVLCTAEDLYLFFQIKREEDEEALRRMLGEATEEALEGIGTAVA